MAGPQGCWNDFCIASKHDGRFHIDATGKQFVQERRPDEPHHEADQLDRCGVHDRYLVKVMSGEINEGTKWLSIDRVTFLAVREVIIRGTKG